MMTIRLPRLPADPLAPFPPAADALAEPDGLLAWGGDLSPARLLNAYRHGIFPWYSSGDPILWWSPDPRMTIVPADLHLSRRLRRRLRQSDWTLRADAAFETVMQCCASAPRAGQRGTWISDEMLAAYVALHHLGHAHSVETLDAAGELVGGVYGVAIGRMFFGESMFSSAPSASQVALAALCRFLDAHGFVLLDGQVASPHLSRMGFAPVRREDFLRACGEACARPALAGSWAHAFGSVPATTLG